MESSKLKVTVVETTAY
jgi:phosphoglucomutase